MTEAPKKRGRLFYKFLFVFLIVSLVPLGIVGYYLVNLSQVILCLLLPLAMFPLLYFTSSRKIMGQWRNGWVLLTLGWGSAILITVMDLYSLPESLKEAWRIIVGG